jgi:hypothetical protein
MVSGEGVGTRGKQMGIAAPEIAVAQVEEPFHGSDRPALEPGDSLDDVAVRERAAATLNPLLRSKAARSGGLPPKLCRDNSPHPTA